MAYNDFFYPDYSFVHQEAQFLATAKMQFSSQYTVTVAPRLVREPLVLAVAQLVQIGTASKVDHGGWAAHQHLRAGIHILMNLGCPNSFQILTKLSSDGGKRAFSIISALMKPELYFHPSPGLWNTFWFDFEILSKQTTGFTCQ